MPFDSLEVFLGPFTNAGIGSRSVPLEIVTLISDSNNQFRRNTQSIISFISKELECCVSSAMERTELLKRLEQVEHQVRQVTELIARQRRILAELNKVLVDTDDPQILLQRYENLLVFHLQERERLRAELDDS